MEEEPNLQTQQLYDMIDAGNEQLWLGCENMTKLSVMAISFSLKSAHHVFERCYNEFM
ncbi:hypothetical protein Syun_029687 [Stephania yunnanensis]|uniref:Uncharacterized protein n=1 Tax=Stephania yunnanensis TaxID=152371 RepID=A0AAP0EDN6_9MAGN